MGRKRTTLSEQIRQAVNASGRSRYSICKACRIDPAGFSRFMAGTMGLTMAHLDAVADLLDLRLAKAPAKKKTKRPKARKDGGR